MFRRHPVLSVFAVLYLCAVGALTLGASAYGAGAQGVIWSILDTFAEHPSTAWINYSLFESAANVGMFIPVGLFLVLLVGRGRWWLALISGVAISVAIELWQGIALPSRVSDPNDVIANGAGALIGVLVGAAVTSVVDVRRRRLRVGH